MRTHIAAWRVLSANIIAEERRQMLLHVPVLNFYEIVCVSVCVSVTVSEKFDFRKIKSQDIKKLANGNFYVPIEEWQETKDNKIELMQFMFYSLWHELAALVFRFWWICQSLFFFCSGNRFWNINWAKQRLRNRICTKRLFEVRRCELHLEYSTCSGCKWRVANSSILLVIKSECSLLIWILQTHLHATHTHTRVYIKLSVYKLPSNRNHMATQIKASYWCQ